MAGVTDPFQLPKCIERLIKASAYRFLPGWQQEEMRKEQEQESRLVVLQLHNDGQTWTDIKPQVQTIVRNKVIDARRRLSCRRSSLPEAPDGQAESCAARDDNPDGDRREYAQKHRIRFIKAILYGAKVVERRAREGRDAETSRLNDLVAREFGRMYLRCQLRREPRCVADIGRDVGITDRRRANETYHRIMQEAKEYMQANGLSGRDE